MACIGTVIALVALFLSALVLNSSLAPSQSPNITIKNDSPTDDPTNTSKEYDRGFEDGRDILIKTLNITMYDMYRTHDILDFETLFEELFERMGRISQDDKYRTETIEHMNEYLKGRDDDTNNY